MYSQLALEIAGHRDERVPNTFLRQDEETSSLAIVLPGYRYTTDMPLLYYPTELLLARGMDVLLVQYAYHLRATPPDWSAPAQRQQLFDDVVAAARQGLAQRSYRRVVLLGKSVGTLAMAGLLAAGLDLPELVCLWLTPLLPDAWLCAQIESARPESLFMLGTADWCYDEALLERLVAATAGRRLVIEGGDHSLEFPGDLPRTLRTVERIAEAMAEMVA